MKYILSPTGKILNENLNPVENITKDVIRISNPISGKFSNKANVLVNNISNASIFKVFTDYEEDEYPLKDVVNKTSLLRNNSFGFIDDKDDTLKRNSNREISFYNSYNTVFDLEDENFDGNFPRIFSTNLDLYGFPQAFTNPIDYITIDTFFRITTLIDSIIAASIPIATISILQFLLQIGQSNPISITDLLSDSPNKSYDNFIKKYEIGTYIKYFFDAGNSLDFLNILKVTLNSFERLMNFPKFQMNKVEDILSFFKEMSFVILDRILYFFVGYSFYLIPGLKTTTKLSVDLSSILGLIENLLVADSSRHPFNLLIRKVLRNNYFFKKSQTAKDSKSTNFTDISNSLSSLGTFFYRFIGERVSVGEKIIKINENQKINEDIGVFSKYRDKNRKLIHTLNSTTSLQPEKNKDNYLTQRNKNLTTLNKDNHRISAENVKDIEKIIEKDYVPFSIHDLRNNDIIKFHAFIESISDSFSSNYNEFGGHGRPDKIKTFISTTRSINLSFRLIATSKDDHDEMWHTINKIIMMIYPQWSKGVPARKISKDEFKINYTLPYTQLPSNTPMVRIRLGDLFKSNYNKRSIANIFGLIPNYADYSKLSDNEKIFFEDLKRLKKNELNKFLQGKEYIVDNEFNIQSLNKENSEIENLLKSTYKIKINKESDNKIGMPQVENNENSEIIKGYIELYNVNIDAINSLTENTTKNPQNDKKYESKTNRINNPITYAYETTAGKGLAGHITSLGIDWDQDTPWDIDKGNRAPMFVKVTIGFSPVHDIPLGLDYNGMMVSVPYMVGKKVKGIYNDEEFVYNETELSKGRR